MRFNVSISTIEQLDTVLKYNIDKLYIPFDLFYWELATIDTIDRIHRDTDIKIYISLPRIMRKRDEMYAGELKNFLLLGKIDGILVRNLEELGFINSISGELEQQFISINGVIKGYTTLFLDIDSNVYSWNKHSLAFNKSYASGVCAPLELTMHELNELDDKNLIIPIYGRAPLMVSANCVKKTTNNCMADCTHGSFEWKLSDRMKKQHLVYCNCIHCYNEIFNACVTSYHKQFESLIKMGFNHFKLDFTDENNYQIRDIMDYYMSENKCSHFPLSEYTQGHILKGTI